MIFPQNGLSESHVIFFIFKRKLLLTTLTELRAMAAPAIIGFRRNPVKG